MDKNICSLPGCSKIQQARGWCPMHYQRWRTTGDPLTVPYSRPYRRLKRDSLEALMSYVEKTDTCWLWLCKPNAGGYGQLTVNGRTWPAHRLSYTLHVGPIPIGLDIDHLCRVRLCVRPDHLEAVTPLENLLRSPTSPVAINAGKTACDHGHEFTTENTGRDILGNRVCRACSRRRAARYREQQRSQ